MKIGLFSDTFPPELNGVANSTYILRNTLEKMGHEVYVVTTYAGAGFSKWDEEHKVLRIAGMELGFLYGYIATQPVHLHALEEIRKLKLDIIHVHTEFGVGIFARICSHLLEIPLVSTYHTTYEDYTHYVNFLHSDAVDNVAKTAVARLSKLYGESSMEVIAPSQKTKDMLLRYKIRREISVIPTGLPLDSFSPSLHNPARTAEIRSTYGIPQDAKLIIYLGRIAAEKALDLVVRGFAKAVENGEHVYLLIVGGGPDAEHIQSLINSLNVQEYCRMAGPHPSSEVPDFYRSADCFISASLSETQGMTFIEAMAAGLPLMARKDEVLEKLIDEDQSGWYFADEEDLAGLIHRFAEMSDEKMQQMAECCLAKVVPYSADIFGQKVEAVYKHVVSDYRYRMTVEEAKVKGSLVQLTLTAENGEDMKIQLSLDDYYNFGVREGGKISRRAIARLQEHETEAIGYQKCLNRIAYKDRSEKEITDYLKTHTECTPEMIASIVKKLTEKRLIDDERYTVNMIEHYRNILMGDTKIFHTLLKKGIKADLIAEKLNEVPADAETSARKYAAKVVRTHSHDSVRKVRSTVRMKLIEQGYSSDIASEVASTIDCTDNEARETDNLRRCALKAKSRYEKKYSGSMLRNRIFRYCAVQGYTDSEIYTVLDGLEVSDD